jgi:hypothetical protein
VKSIDGLVDLRRQRLDAPRFALGDDAHDLVDLVAVGRHQRAQELDREVRLQVGRLVRDERVRRAVALVEAVAREVLEQVEDLLGLGLLVAAFLAPSTKVAFCLAISSSFFLPIARRSRSAPPSE